MPFILDSHKALVRIYGTLLARIFIGVLFLLGGIGKIADFDGTVGYIASTGAPMPELLNILAIVAEVGGGLALILGIYVAEAAAGLIVFTLGTIVLFHPPSVWFGKKDMGATVQQIMFMKNLAIIGGLLYIIGYGAGDGFSLEKKKPAEQV